jgi:hypothetical protein
MDSASVHRWYSKVRSATHLDRLAPRTRRVVVAAIGAGVLLVGLAMLVLPGPAVLVIPLGLLILASEFAWARRLLSKARSFLRTGKSKLTGR